MIKLKSIYIHGFKDKNREIKLTFSEEPITVIYGENGCGKTTFLRVLNAILSKNDDILIAENIQEIILEYILDTKTKNLNILIDDESVNWGDNIDDFIGYSSSVALGVHRGMTENEGYLEQMNILEQANDFVNNFKELENNNKVIVSICDFALNFIQKQTKKYKRFTQIEIDNNKHIFADFISTEEIRTSVINFYTNGQEMLNEKIMAAFSETFDNAEQILSLKNEQSFILPLDFYEQIKPYKKYIEEIILERGKSNLGKDVLNYLETQKITNNSKIFTALLLRILKKIQEPNPYLEAINKLVEIFNSYLYGGKKLVINSENVYIYLGVDENGQDKIHSINDLSSGERNFLTMLSLFLVFEQQRNFIIIDEPEISLNMKWQRKILPLFNELSPNSQIIVATHSPSIAHKKSNYLVELI
jgi:ABC-type cobalamin/Fe3+-siderophores transport system ATPase subunit